MAKTTTDTLSLELVASINELTTKIDITTSKLRGLQNSVGSLKSTTKGLSTEMTDLGKKIDDAGKKAKKNSGNITIFGKSINAMSTAVKTFIAARFADYIGASIQKSMQYTEDLNLFAVAMKDYAGEATQFLNQLSTLGIDQAAATRTMGLFFQVSNALGLSSKNAYALSENFTKLSYDLASFYNIGIEDAVTKLQAGLVGETEPLRRIGIVITENNLAETARRLGIEKSIRTMTEAEKIELRFVTAMQQSKNAMNDFERTIQNPQNQVKILQMQLSILSRTIGNVFIPILTKVLPYIIAFVKALAMLMGGVADLAGFDQTKPITDAFDPTNAKGFADGVGKAAKEAKKLKDYTMGIDELNIMNQDTGKSGSGDNGAGIGGGLGLDLSEFGYADIIKDIEDKTAALIPKMQELIKWLLVIGGILLTIWAVHKLKQFWDILVEVGTILKGVGLTLLKWIGPIAIIIGAVTFFSAILDILSGKGDILYNVIKGILGIAAIVIGMFIVGFGAIPALITAIIALFILLGVTIYKLWDDIVANFEYLGYIISKFFKDIWKGIVDWFSDVGKYVYGIVSNIGKWFASVWDNMKKSFSNAWNWILKILGSGGNIFNGIINGIGNVFKNAINWLLKGINYVIRKPFDFMNWVLNKIRNVSIAGAHPFKGFWKEDPIYVPQIPLLADGGFVGEGQMFIAREAGPEMVGTIGGKTAVANNDQIVSAIKQGVIEAMLMSNQGDRTINIENKLLLDNEVVYKKQQAYGTNRGVSFGSDGRFV